jgi:hypothetical protein
MASFQRPLLIMGRARMVQNCVLGVFILIALIATQPASAGRSLLESEDSAKTHHLYWTVINDIGLIISRGPNWLQFPSTDPFSFLFFLLFWVQIECTWIAKDKQTSSDPFSSRMNNLVHTEWTHWRSDVKKKSLWFYKSFLGRAKMPTRMRLQQFKRCSEPEMKTLDWSDYWMTSGSIHKELKAVLDDECGKRRISSSVIEQLSDGRSFTLRVDLVNNVLSFLNYRCNSQQQS